MKWLKYNRIATDELIPTFGLITGTEQHIRKPPNIYSNQITLPKCRDKP
jgi:hypothetical protein